MSSFTCEHCGKSIIDDGGYITECEHYPMEGDAGDTAEQAPKEKSE